MSQTTTLKMVERIQAVLDQSTSAEKVFGRRWYAEAHMLASEIAADNDVPLPKVVAIVSVLSPGVKWERNINDAKYLVRMWAMNPAARPEGLSTYGPNVIKAIKIMNSRGDPESWFHPEKAPKTRAFYHNILYPWQDGYVTIDGHAWNITQAPVPAGLRFMPDIRYAGRYEQAASAYRITAELIGLLPHQVQATSWLTWRRMHRGD